MDLQRCEEKTELTSTSDRAWKLFTAIRQRMTKAALEQMNRLAECALNGKSESDQARKAVCSILLSYIEQSLDINRPASNGRCELFSAQISKKRPTVECLQPWLTSPAD